jgi:hypothetical protein
LGYIKVKQSNKEAFWGITQGAAAILLFLGLFALFVHFLGGGLGNKDDWAKFKVVDKYRYCDVVRYMPEGGAKYYYFLDCNGTGAP